MVKIKNKDTDPVSSIVQGISYGTGLLCAKMSNLSKVTKTKEWKSVVSTTQDLVKNAGKSVQESFTEMKESFDEGVKSIVEDGNKPAKSKPVTRKNKADADIQDAVVVPREKEVVAEEEIVAKKEPVAKEEVVVDKEVVTQEEPVAKEEVVVDKEVVAQEEPVAKEEVVVDKEVVAQEEPVAKEEVLSQEADISPLPAELAPQHHDDSGEDLMEEEEDAPKKKAEAPKAKKNAALPVDPAGFTLREFRKDGKDPQALMDSILKNKKNLQLIATDPIEWLNELLIKGESGLPLKYAIKETPELLEAREAFESAAESDKPQKMILLNRLTLELAYPRRCPKLPTADKSKTKRAKRPEGEINLN